MTFLDCKVKISNGGIETELFMKVTDAHLYFLALSCHPKHTINGIPKGQFTRIRRICSTLDLYWKHTNSYIQFFVERVYNLQKLQNIAKEVSKYNRDDLLAYKIKVKDSVSKIPKDLFIHWHPNISKLSFILNKNKNILKDSSHVSKIFPDYMVDFSFLIHQAQFPWLHQSGPHQWFPCGKIQRREVKKLRYYFN